MIVQYGELDHCSPFYVQAGCPLICIARVYSDIYCFSYCVNN